MARRLAGSTAAGSVRGWRWARYADRLEAGYAVGAEELHQLSRVTAWPRTMLGAAGGRR